MLYLLLCVIPIQPLPCENLIAVPVGEPIPHDSNRFTEGLTIEPVSGMVIESTGFTHKACLFKTPIQQPVSPYLRQASPVSATNDTHQLAKTSLASQDAPRFTSSSKAQAQAHCESGHGTAFGEGIAILDGMLYQLSYRARTASV